VRGADVAAGVTIATAGDYLLMIRPALVATGATGPTGPVSTVAGPAGATGPKGAMGATGAVPAFDNSNTTGAALGAPYDLYFSPVPNGNNNGVRTLTFPSVSEAVAPQACMMGNLSVGAILTATGNTVGDGTQAPSITLFQGTGANPATATALECRTQSIANTLGSFSSQHCRGRYVVTPID